jgi:polyhydroxyalkanoate synthesis regulator phasin
MSKAKKTKRAKEYSQQNLYRHIDNLLRHAKNKESRMSDQDPDKFKKAYDALRHAPVPEENRHVMDADDPHVFNPWADQPRTAAELPAVDIRFKQDSIPTVIHGQLTAASAQALYDDLLARLPEKHPDTDVPSDNLNAQEDGEAIGYNQAIDDCKAILRAYFLVGEDGAV